MAAKDTPVYYILHGENGFERDDYLRRLRARMGTGPEAELNMSEFRAEDGCTVAEVVGNVQTMPFLSDQRLVVVHGLLLALVAKAAGKGGKADLDTLVAELPKLPDHARLVFAENGELTGSHPVIKLLDTDSRGFEKRFDLPKQMADWVARRAVAQGVEIEPKAAAMLGALIGFDLYSADSEIAKLAAFVNWERPISAADVELMTANSVETKFWDLTDAIGARNAQKAMTIAQKIVGDGGEPMSLLANIYSHFRRLMMVKAAHEENFNGNLSAAVGSSGYGFTKLGEQARRFSYDELETIHRLLSDTDYKIKSGEVKQDLALDLLVATLCN